MSDSVLKAEKLAAARRKLKEHQTSKKSKPTTNDSLGDGQERSDLVASQESIPSKIAEESQLQVELEKQLFQVQNLLNSGGSTQSFQQTEPPVGPSLANYFNNGTNGAFDNNLMPATVDSADPFDTIDSQPASNNNDREIEELRQQIASSNCQVQDLQTKLSTHITTVNVLVEEKTNLTNSLHKLENLVLQKNTESDELKHQLQSAQSRLQQLENEVAHGRRFEETHQAINSELMQYQTEIRELKRVYEESQDDLAELKQKFTLKTADYQALYSELEKTRSDLQMAHLKVQQLASADEPATNSGQLEQMVQSAQIKDQQIEELRKTIDQINQDRLLNDQKYQNYVISLNQERASLAEQIQQLAVDKQKAQQREDGLVKHVSELERQIQQQIQRQQQVEHRNQEMPGGTEPGNVEEVEKLKTTIANLEAQLTEEKKQIAETLSQQQAAFNQQHAELQAKQQQLADQDMTIERLQTGQPNSMNLMAEIESQKVAASRAVGQNQQLKEQLEEMQNAFVQMSNDKLELTDRLQSEQHLGREMRNGYQQMEMELTMLRDRFNLKDEEMIRMSHENTELEKKIFQNNLELDRLRHYEAHGEAGNILQQELQKLQEDNRHLQMRVDDLEAKAMHDHHHDHQHDDYGHEHSHETACESHTSDLAKENEMLRLEKDELLKVIKDFQYRRPQNGEGDASDHSPGDDNRSETASTATPSIATSEAMEKLQQRFKRTIQEVADLTEEKYRLEHLVQRLQSETETIGEYITLYQTQRRLLKQKDLERDTQLKSLAADRELMKNRLVELNKLIEQLITSKGQLPNGQTKLDTDFDPEVENNNTLVAEEATEAPAISANGPNIVEHNKELDFETKATADKILALLSDIKTANSNTFHSFSGVKHCSCCSGKLQTV